MRCSRGDYLLDATGKPTRVVAATEVMTGRPCYEMSFDDGTVVIADADHQWLTDTRASRKSAQAAAAGYNRIAASAPSPRSGRPRRSPERCDCDTADQRTNHSVQNAAPLDLPHRDLPVPPYTLGAWLGDGHSNAARLTSADPEMPSSEGLVIAA